jgi:ubiquinone/menaquinone biosynthesis C-methylase UbiE
MPTDINERQHFNQWSSSYERSFMQWLLFDRVHRGVLRRIPPDFTPEEVLDIGCGTGRLLRRMGRRWPAARLNGVDLAEGMAAMARQQTPDAAIYLAPAERLPLADAAVDLATSTTSFHHWSDQAQGIREAGRVVRRGGLFILADMSVPTHGRAQTPRQVRALFEAAGFKVRSQTNPVLFFTFTVGEKG